MAMIEHGTLACPRCGQETRHELAYAGRLLVVTTCTRCEHSIERDVRARYVADLRQRLASKPGRMLRRFRRHPLTFTTSLPRTVPSKPLELVAEVKLVLRASRRVRGRGG
jgi:hypothetical protein